MNVLIPINYDAEQPTVSARDLHKALNVQSRFSRWFDTNASYYKSQSRYFNYAYVAVKWSEAENATSYKVRVTKTDGSYKEYDTTYTAFYSTNYTDDFIVNDMDGASSGFT